MKAQSRDDYKYLYRCYEHAACRDDLTEYETLLASTVKT